jgi:predicted metal-dependent hydrolase
LPPDAYTNETVPRIVFERSRRAKQISISIKPYRGVRVAVPHGVSFGQAKAFARSKEAWIQKHVTKMERLEREHQHLVQRFSRIDRENAKQILGQRLNDLAQQHGFSYNRITVRNQKTRWGSCSHNNNISLNAKLIGLPARLMDYILLHELVHTRHKNHGTQFYHALERIVGCRKPFEEALKHYEIALL